jgi:pyruvate formate lyase activating enzyme
MQIQGQSPIQNEVLWTSIKKKYNVKPNIPMLPWSGVVGKETRRLYFDLAVTNGKMNHEPVIRGSELGNAVARSLPVNRLISYGDCNVSCPYCKRDCQFIGSDGNVLASVNVPIDDVLRLCLWGLSRGETPRFSGGDPVSFKKETLAIAEYIHVQHRQKVSIAHNGTWGQSIRELVPYLSSAAIDLKAVPEKMGKIMGIKAIAGDAVYQQSLKTQAVVSNAGVLLDVRTPIFGDTKISEMIRLGGAIALTNDLSKTFWTWRLYKEVDGCDWSVPELDKTIGMMLEVSDQIPELWMGMRAKWQAGGMIYFKAGHCLNSTHNMSSEEKVGSGNQDLAAANFC